MRSLLVQSGCLGERLHGPQTADLVRREEVRAGRNPPFVMMHNANLKMRIIEPANSPPGRPCREQPS